LKSFVPSLLKERNSRSIYNLFSDGNAYSKADISRLTGISAPTVIKVIDSFIEKGILLNAGEGESVVGRKPTLLVLNTRAYYAIGVDFQNGKVRAGLVDLEGTVIDVLEKPLQREFREILLHDVCEMIYELRTQNVLDVSSVLGVGLGLPGVVDCEKNTVEYAYSIGMNEKTDCTELISEFNQASGLPVYIDNDINAAAIGEFKARKLTKAEDLLYISLGTGLGAGIVLNGKLRHGIHYFAGEIAYTSFDEDYVSKNSSIGWLERRISDGDAVNRAVKRFEGTENYIGKISKTLALTIANFSVLLDFDQVVIGGLLSEHFGKEILVEIEKNLKKMSLFKINCDLARSALPELTGSAIIVYEHRLKDIL
jgi:predicted NBD/HSP70 family sugar kinase